MVERIYGDNGGQKLTPAQKAELEKEYKQMADGFQQTLNKYNEMESISAKSTCKDTMEECMNAMNGITIDLHKHKLLQQTNLEKDLNNLSPDNTDQLQKDLDKAKKIV
jgi:hypothetical protein